MNSEKPSPEIAEITPADQAREMKTRVLRKIELVQKASKDALEQLRDNTEDPAKKQEIQRIIDENDRRFAEVLSPEFSSMLDRITNVLELSEQLKGK